MPDAIVSGAAGGLGICITKQYLDSGYRVFAFVRQIREELEQLAAVSGGRLVLLEADIGSTESTEKASRQVASLTDSLDEIVNVAAVLPNDAQLPFGEANIDSFLSVIDVNALGYLRVIQKNYELLKKGHDPIAVNVSSAGASFKHIIDWDTRLEYPYAYCMSKAALNMGSAILQRYTNLDGVRVICVHPGLLETRMNAGNRFAEDLISPEKSARCIFELAERERAKDTGNLFFNFDGEVFPY